MAARHAAVRVGAPSSAEAVARPSAVSVHGGVSELQRARLLSAAVMVVEELGYTQASVAHITRKARVSRRTFYDLFDNREACLLAAIQNWVDQLAAELTAPELVRLPWRERVRTGLGLILAGFDREPVLARLCVVQSARGSQRVLEWREQVLARLAAVLDEGRHESARAERCPSLTAEGLVGATLAILSTRLLKRDEQPLGDLLGELMGMIVLPYLGSRAAARERSRVTPPSHQPAPHTTIEPPPDPLRELPMRLTYRTARVLTTLAERPDASNREVARSSGITDQGQISKLLARLERLGLLCNTSDGYTKGEANAWRLTPTGLKIIESIRLNTGHLGRVA